VPAMAIRKVCGIETEYGIAVRGADSNPVAASSVLINAYIATLDRRTVWDFEDESPGIDARGFAVEGALPPEVETHLVNTVLTNGSRYYVDHAHPEVSTPECIDAKEVVVFDRASEEVLKRSMIAARNLLPDGAEIVVYKNNSDGKGNSYGCHENYLLSRELPFGRLVSQITPHFVTRQLFESPGVPSSEVPFQLSQRADFFEEEVGLETTLKRPIVNTRDEPHCDGQRYRRFHVIVGDANRSEVATFLKVGTTAIVLSMIEDDQLPVDLTLANPVGAIRQVSHDPTLTRTVALKSGRRVTALDVQWQLLEQARKYERERGLDSVGDEVGAEILRRWEEVLTSLEGDRSSAATTVDWVAKERLFEAYRERHGLEWSDARLRAMDIQYHDLRDDRSLFDRFGLERLCTAEEVERAVTEPPTTTRAYFRGKCLQKWPNDIVAANWDSMVFDIGRDPLRRVPMMEPLRGTAAHVARLIADSTSAADLLERLGA
jgi:Pup amidohydrolase